MIQSIRGWCWKLKLASFSTIIYTAIATSGGFALAQIAPDSTLGSESSTVTMNNPSVDQINGGAVRGKNLFHSFQEFNVDEGRGAYFTNPDGIENIISRVTGGKPSNIQGTLGVLGNANLFLLNPNGIIFGSNASLDVRGSFVASTASSLKFADGTQFSATAPQTSPLLTVSVPIGLQFGAAPGSIVNRSQASPNGAINSLGLPVGLQVQTGKTLVLVGGDMSLEGGNLTAAGGRIELGSVAAPSLVNLTPTKQGWILGYESVQNFQDIRLTQQSILDASGEGGGYVQIQGRDVLLKDVSVILSETQGAGDGGDIRLNTRKLIAQGGAQISTSSSGVYLFEPPYFIPGAGKGGNLTVNASELVELTGTSLDDFRSFSGLTSATFSSAKAGDITVNTRRLIIRDGARITTESGDVDLPGQRILATGKGGNLTVNASESMELTDGLSKQTGLFTEIQGTGDAGNLTIKTGRLTIRDGAQLSVSSEGTADAGNLNVTANSTRLENGGKLTATSALGKGGGNINLQDLNLLLLRGNSEISTNAEGEGNGGNITIDTDLLVGLDNSDITATAVRGRGGNIQINSQAIFGIEPRRDRTPESDITASSELGVDGVVEINRPEADPSAELVVLPTDIVDVSGLIAQGCSANGGNMARGLSEFIATGRGGLPPNPSEALRSETALADLGKPVQGEANRASAATTINPTSSSPVPLVEAQGWVIGSKGEVLLTAQAPTVTPHIPWLTPTTCHGS